MRERLSPSWGGAVMAAAAFRPHGFEGLDDLVDAVPQQSGEGEEAEGLEEPQLRGCEFVIGLGGTGVGGEGCGVRRVKALRPLRG